MDKKLLKILGLHRAEFEKAKSNEQYAWVAQSIVSIAAIVSLFVKVELLIYFTTLIALASTIAKWGFSYQAKSQKSMAERARRLILLFEALGYKISKREITDLQSCFSASETKGQQWENADYFSSSLAPGYAKLASHLQESAFYSKHLYSISAKRIWYYFAVISVASLIGLFVLPSIKDQTWSIAIARFISVILMFLIATDLLGRALGFSEASNSLSEIDYRIENVKSSDFPEHDIILILEDYNAAVQGAPLIPTSIYLRNMEKLNLLWAERNG